MTTLSLCMIVRDEEDTLKNCLASVEGIFDEIVIVDTGSKDRTRAVAKEYGAKIFDFVWGDDFSSARNFSFSQGTMEYLMWLDADDILLPEDNKRLKALKANLDGEVRQLLAPYNVSLDEAGKPLLSFNRERIFLRSAGFRWVGEIHETIEIDREAKLADFAVTHHKLHPTEKGRNLRIFQKLLREGKNLDARQEFYYARELYYNDRSREAIVQFEHFLARKDAWVENSISACLDLSKCYQIANDLQAAKSSLVRSFVYDLPRAEICCALGLLYLDGGDPKKASFWYETALRLKKDPTTGGFVNPECYGYIPAIQLCVCYDRLGEKEKAIEYNELAAKHKPYSEAVKYNRRYFTSPR